jgi:hypothetical protein
MHMTRLYSMVSNNWSRQRDSVVASEQTTMILKKE